MTRRSEPIATEYLGAELTVLLLFLVYYPPNVLSRLGVRDLRGPSAPAAAPAAGASKRTATMGASTGASTVGTH